MQEHEGVERTEFQFLPAHHAFFDDISPEMFRFYTQAVVHEVFHILVVNAVPLIVRLLVRRSTLLFVSFGPSGRATRRRVHHIAKEPGIQ